MKGIIEYAVLLALTWVLIYAWRRYQAWRRPKWTAEDERKYQQLKDNPPGPWTPA